MKVGMAADMAAIAPDRPRQYEDMARSGITILRQGFRQEYGLGAQDAIVLDAARAGLRFMPVIIGPFPPRDVPAFAAAVARRYGRGGSLWAEHPDVPAHPTISYQVWNEPNFPSSWGGKPSAGAYVKLLNATAAAIRGVDRQAEIITAGIADSRAGVPLEKYVGRIKGAHFDSLAVHSYPPKGGSVVDTIHRGLHAMGGSRKVWLTEFGWATGGPPSSHTISEAAQAARIKAAVRDLYDTSHLRGFIYYGWQDLRPYEGRSDYWGLHTGLLRLDGSRKPGRLAFIRAVRGR